MNTQFDIERFLEKGEIQNELDFERALIAEGKLRVMAKDHPEFKAVRKKLRDLLEVYEKKTWSAENEISEDKLKESDWAEEMAEKERVFLHRRKYLIKKKLTELDLSQQDFGKILGHPSKSYMSELMNGVRPFSLKDLIIISKLLKIELNDLIPTFLPQKEKMKIIKSVQKLGNPKLTLNEDEFALV